MTNKKTTPRIYQPNKKTIKNKKTNLRHTLLVLSCVLLTALGFTILNADSTTTIGLDVSTGDLALTGNVTSGTWQGSVVGTQYGGTGQNFNDSTGIIKLTNGTASVITDNSTDWDTAYTYSQVGHLPLTGGTLSSDLTIQETGDAKITIYSNTDDSTADFKLLVVQKGTDPTELFSIDNEGDIIMAGDLSVSGGELYLTGIDSSLSTTEGTMYYDTDDDQLKVYANDKWQSDRSTATIIVGTSNISGASLNYEKADYVCNGTDDQDTIQTAINALPDNGGDIFLLDGNYQKGDTTGISIPSFVTIRLSQGATFSLADGLNVDASFFTNSDKVNGNERINIIGGKFDCNQAGQSAGYQFMADFENVNGGKIDSFITNYTMLEAKLKCCGVEMINRRYDVEPIIFAPCESIDEFTGTGGTCTVESGGAVGDNSVKMVAADPTRAHVDKILPNGIDVEAYMVDFWIKFDDVSKILGLTLGGDAAGSLDWQLDSAETLKLFQSDVWYHIQLPLKYYIFSDEPTFRIRLAPTSGQTAIIYIDNIMFTPVSPTPHVSFQFDDGWETANYHTIEGAEIMAKYGFAGSVQQMGPDYCGAAYLSRDELDLLYFKYGWDVGTHAYSHWESDVSLETVKSVAITNRKFIEDNGWGKGASYLIYAGHDTRGEINDAMIRIFSGYRNPLKLVPIGLMGNKLNYASQASVSATTYTPSDDVLELMRRHIWFQHYTHYIYTGQMTPEYLDSFCQFWHDWGLELETPSEVLGLQTTPVTYAIHSTSDLFMDLLAASTTAIHNAITGTGAAQEITTAITNPDVARNISITTTNVTSPSGNVTITGVDAKGTSTTEDIAISAGGTAYGNKAFATVSKITIPASVTADDTVAVGISNKLGLSNIIYASSDVYKVKKNNADATIGTVNTTYGTVDCATITGGDDFTIYYKSNLNIIN